MTARYCKYCALEGRQTLLVRKAYANGRKEREQPWRDRTWCPDHAGRAKADNQKRVKVNVPRTSVDDPSLMTLWLMGKLVLVLALMITPVHSDADSFWFAEVGVGYSMNISTLKIEGVDLEWDPAAAGLLWSVGYSKSITPHISINTQWVHLSQLNDDGWPFFVDHFGVSAMVRFP